MDTMSISQTPALQTLVERGGDYSVCQLTSNTACNNFSEHVLIKSNILFLAFIYSGKFLLATELLHWNGWG